MQYKTIKFASNDEYVVKRSRFIGYTAPATTQEEATEFINSIKTKHWDARHNVYAYVLRDGQTRRYSDDGEPQGTAGVPVLDVLLKENITDCVVVVTRYFGGVLLGTGGLVRAYSHTAKLAIDKSNVITMKLSNKIKIKCDYTFYGRLPSLIAQFGGITDDVEYAHEVIVQCKISKDVYDEFENNLIDLSNGRFYSEIINEEYAEFT